MANVEPLNITVKANTAIMESINPGDEEVAFSLTEGEVADAGSVDDGVAERQVKENTTTAPAPEMVSNQPGERKLRLAAEDHGQEKGSIFHNPTNELHPLPGVSTSNDDGTDHEEELDRKPAFSTIRRGSDLAYLEESKMEEEGPPIGFSFVDKEVVLVDPTIMKNISNSGATSSSDQESVINNNNQESVPPKTTTPQRGPEEQQYSLNSMGRQQFTAGLDQPTIPRRTAFGAASTSEGNAAADDKEKLEYNSLREQHAIAGSGLPLPDYKAQVNRRSFLRVNQDDLLVDGIPEDRQEGSSSSATRQSAAAAAVSTPSSEGASARVPVVAQHVITSSMAQRISDTTNSNGVNDTQDDAAIPVVSAVLVPQERLEVEYRHQIEGQNSGTAMITATNNPLIQPPSQRTVSVIAPSQLPAGYEFYVDDPTTPNVSLLVKVPAGGARAMQPFVAIVVRELNLGSHSIPHGKWRDGICDCWNLGCCHPQWCLTFWCTPCALGQVLTRLKLNVCASPKQAVDTRFTAFQILFAIQVVYIVVHFLFSLVGYSFMSAVLPVIMFIFIVIVTMIARRYVRNKYQIPEKTCCCKEDGGCRGCEDFCCAFWCGPCSICQLARHTADYHRQQAGCCTEDGLGTGMPSVV